ncbi:SH3 domain-containing protein [Leeia oryzae]|uniref:SH3 domain-containing protein n=1 Tax=Leeia oryzae TaxID=356662 RepID=UPI0003A26EAD|nr:SH3 domain-containing protein [Leeia oryzae]
MRRLKRFGLLVMLSCFCLPVAAEDFAIVQGPANANVRSGNAEYARILRSVSPGARVEILTTSSTYTRVKLDDGTTGWILNRLLQAEPKLEKAASAPEAVTVENPVVDQLKTELAQTRQQLSDARRLSEPRQEPRFQNLSSAELLAGVGLFLLGGIVGSLGVIQYYRKKLNGLRI